MRLWTIQSVDAYQTLKVSGRLRCIRRFADTEFLPAYEWMADQMDKRLRLRPSRQSLPLWAWYQWEGRRRKPDLRRSGYVPKGQRAVLMELDVDESRVLLSDFDLWHYVLNYWYLPSSAEDGDALESELDGHGLSFFRSKPLPHHRYHARIVESWNRILDLDWEAKDLAGPKTEKSIQANVWEFDSRDVRSVREFVGR